MAYVVALADVIGSSQLTQRYGPSPYCLFRFSLVVDDDWTSAPYTFAASDDITYYF